MNSFYQHITIPLSRLTRTVKMSPMENFHNRNTSSKPKETQEKSVSCWSEWEETTEPRLLEAYSPTNTKLHGKPKRVNTKPTCMVQWLKTQLWKLAKPRIRRFSWEWRKYSRYWTQQNWSSEVGISMTIT